MNALVDAFYHTYFAGVAFWDSVCFPHIPAYATYPCIVLGLLPNRWGGFADRSWGLLASLVMVLLYLRVLPPGMVGGHDLRAILALGGYYGIRHFPQLLLALGLTQGLFVLLARDKKEAPALPYLFLAGALCYGLLSCATLMSH